MESPLAGRLRVARWSVRRDRRKRPRRSSSCGGLYGRFVVVVVHSPELGIRSATEPGRGQERSSDEPKPGWESAG